MPRVLNWASTCKNQTVGSIGQNGGNLMLTAARDGELIAGVAAIALDSISTTVSIDTSIGVAIVGED